MGRVIIKIKDRYFIWSSVVDAPITYGTDLEGLKEWVKFEHGEQGLRDLTERLERVDTFGTSSEYGYPIEDLIRGNRAGENETTITLDEIYERYTEETE